METKLEEQFARIAQGAIEEAEGVLNCDIDEFYQGVQNMITIFQSRMHSATDEGVDLMSLDYSNYLNRTKTEGT